MTKLFIILSVIIYNNGTVERNVHFITDNYDKAVEELSKVKYDLTKWDTTFDLEHLYNFIEEKNQLYAETMLSDKLYIDIIEYNG